ILVEDGFGSFAGSEIVKNDVHRHPRAAKARSAVHTGGVGPNKVAPLHRWLQIARRKSNENESVCLTWVNTAGDRPAARSILQRQRHPLRIPRREIRRDEDLVAVRGPRAVAGPGTVHHWLRFHFQLSHRRPRVRVRPPRAMTNLFAHGKDEARRPCSSGQGLNTCTGTGATPEPEPLPSWPDSAPPQRGAAPRVPPPRVATPRALTTAKVTPPTRPAGVRLLVREPLPSCPK